GQPAWRKVTIHATDGEVDPGTYKVGGCHMSEPTGPARDSSLGINKAPGKCLSCREAQIVRTNIGRRGSFRHTIMPRRRLLWRSWPATRPSAITRRIPETKRK